MCSHLNKAFQWRRFLVLLFIIYEESEKKTYLALSLRYIVESENRLRIFAWVEGFGKKYQWSHLVKVRRKEAMILFSEYIFFNSFWILFILYTKFLWVHLRLWTNYSKQCTQIRMLSKMEKGYKFHLLWVVNLVKNLNQIECIPICILVLQVSANLSPVTLFREKVYENNQKKWKRVRPYNSTVQWELSTEL